MLQCFPDKLTPRPAQIKASNFVAKAIGLGYRDIVIEMPTGGGKSLVAVTACRYGASQAAADAGFTGIQGGYILVHQKLLQDQLAAELDRFSSSGLSAKLVKSSTEYTCIKNPKKTCAGSLGCSAKKDQSCSYRVAKAEFISAAVSATNYAYFLAEREFVGDLADRRVLVLDEAHSVPSLVVNHVGIDIAQDKVDEWSPELALQLAQVQTSVDFLEFLKIYHPQIKSRAEDLQAMVAGGEMGQDFEREASEVQRHALKVEKLCTEYDPNSQDWVFWTSKDRFGNLVASAKPLTAAKHFNALFPAAVRIFLSAYPGARPTFCSELGLDMGQVAWLRLGSDFPAERRKVHLMNTVSMAKRQIETALPTAVRSVVAIVRKHASERGVIHTHSYAFTKAVVEGLHAAGLGDRVTSPEKAEDREAALEVHAARQDSVLVSPSLYEGFDFRGDLARYQIILKCLDPETRVMTLHGLKTYDQLTLDDRVFGLNPDGSLVIQGINAIIVKQHSGYLLDINEGGMVVTPGHRVLLMRKSKTELEYIEASDDLIGKDHWAPRVFLKESKQRNVRRFPHYFSLKEWILPSDKLVVCTSKVRCAVNKCEFLTYDGNSRSWHFTGSHLIEEVEKKIGNVLFMGAGKCKKSPIKFESLRFFELIGWFVSEGWLDNNHQAVYISQTKKRGVKRISKILTALGLHFTHRGGKFLIRSRILFNFFKENVPGRSWQKKFSRLIMDSHPVLLKRMLLGMVRGDGSFRSEKPVSYTTTSLDLRDQVCEMSVKLGLPVTLIERKEAPLYHDKSRLGRRAYIIHFCPRHNKTRLRKIKRVPYSGPVFCLNTDSSNFLVMRKRKFFFTGNCPYASLGDERVKIRAQIEPLWYKIEAFKAFLQAAGRGMRSADDWCVTYVIDKDIARLIEEVREYAPKWFLEAIHAH